MRLFSSCLPEVVGGARGCRSILRIRSCLRVYDRSYTISGEAGKTLPERVEKSEIVFMGKSGTRDTCGILEARNAGQQEWIIKRYF